MRTMTDLIELLKKECELSGKYTYTNRRKAIEEMLRMMGANIGEILSTIK
jgi:hypothetical protein